MKSIARGSALAVIAALLLAAPAGAGTRLPANESHLEPTNEVIFYFPCNSTEIENGSKYWVTGVYTTGPAVEVGEETCAQEGEFIQIPESGPREYRWGVAFESWVCHAGSHPGVLCPYYGESWIFTIDWPGGYLPIPPPTNPPPTAAAPKSTPPSTPQAAPAAPAAEPKPSTTCRPRIVAENLRVRADQAHRKWQRAPAGKPTRLALRHWRHITKTLRRAEAKVHAKC